MTEPSRSAGGLGLALEGRPSGAEISATAVTALFVPGDRPDRYRKAYASGADLVIIDLEDAVATASKPEALAAVIDRLSDGSGLRAMVRVNAANTPFHADELAALSDLLERSGAAGRAHGLIGVMLAKAERPDEVEHLRRSLNVEEQALAIVPLLETAVGVENRAALAAAPGVTRLALGAIDLSVDLDVDLGGPLIGHAMALLAFASRAAGIAAPLASPTIGIDDDEAVERDARYARKHGFGGKLCIHPAQLGPTRRAFRPSDAQLAWARSIVGAGSGASRLDGQMVDRPVIELARRVLRRARG